MCSLPNSSTIFRLAHSAKVEWDESAHLLIIHSASCNYRFENASQSLRTAILLLQEGCHVEDAIVEKLVQNSDAGSYASAFLLLNMLKSSGIIEYVLPVLGGSGELIVESAAQHFYRDWLSQPCSDMLQLSRFALMRFEEGWFIWETPLSPYRIRISNPVILEFIQLFRSPKLFDQACEEFYSSTGYLQQNIEAKAITHTLNLAKILICPNQEKTDTLRQWEFHDLFFHARSRIGRTSNPIGPLFPFIQNEHPIKPVPAVKDIPGIKLPLAASFEQGQASPFQDLVTSRQSRYPSANSTITSEQLGVFLYRCAKIIHKRTFSPQEGLEFEVTSRPYPSAGSLYEMEIYVLVNACQSLEKGLYHYNADIHALTPISTKDDLLNQAIALASQSARNHPPQILLMIAARFPRIAWKYRSYAYALMLKDAGVLTAYLYLTAEDMSLAGCAIGAGNTDLFATMSGTNWYDEAYVADFMLGARGD